MAHNSLLEMTDPSGPILIRILGRPTLEIGGQVVSKFETKVAALILVRLALTPDRPLSRDELAELLWPEDFLDSTRVRLRQELARLRRAAPEGIEFFHSDRQSVGLVRPGVRVDTDEYARRIREIRPEGPDRLATLIELAAMVRGPLAEGLSERWILSERDRWSRLHARTLAHLALARSQDGDQAQAEQDLMAARQLGLDDAEVRALQDLIRKDSACSTPVESPPGPAPVRFSHPVPKPVDVCFGREAELARLEALLLPNQPNSARLVTLTGLGGVGKTRLALELGHRLRADFEGRVAFLEMSSCEEGSSLEEFITRSLGWPSVAEGVSVGPVLLILDEFDAWAESATSEVKRLLEENRSLELLLTSRQATRIGGEREIRVAPFATPDLPGDLLLAKDFPGVALFLDRASAHNPTLAQDRAKLRDVVELVQKLDGIPLAIQMAAHRAQFLTPREILEQIAGSPDFLGSKRRDGAGRHRTLLDTLRWNFDDLAPEVQATFFRLSIFRGGASTSLAGQFFPGFEWVEHAEILRDRSLLQVEESGLEMRMTMLETMRRFSRELMGEDAWQQLRREHCFHLAQWMKTADRADLSREEENLRKALEYARVHEPALAADLITVLEQISRNSSNR
ncbi:MAG TPA: AAA family ATPase [Fimbriimonadaceae bacterium]|nr:AAA family ATPase [Fimbriimonadaceae bacterium]